MQRQDSQDHLGAVEDKKVWSMRSAKQRKKHRERNLESVAKKLRTLHKFKSEIKKKQAEIEDKKQKKLNKDVDYQNSSGSEDSQRKEEIEELQIMRQKLYEQKVEIGANFLSHQVPKNQAKDMKQQILQTQTYKTKMNIKKLTSMLNSKEMLGKLQNEDFEDLELIDSDDEKKKSKNNGDSSSSNSASSQKRLKNKNNGKLVNKARFEQYQKVLKDRKNSLLNAVLSDAYHSKTKRKLADLIVKFDLKLERSKALENYSQSTAIVNQYGDESSVYSFYKTGQMFNMANGVSINKEKKKQKEQEEFDEVKERVQKQIEQDKIDKLQRMLSGNKRKNWAAEIRKI